MNEYEFTLKFSLQATSVNPEDHLDKLYEAGCDDAIVGTGKKGSIALDFIREADSAFDAISSALMNVKSAIPEAKLIEATPDIVGLTEVADMLGCSRQNIRQ
ncbi:MAG: DNA-binding protein, partial [Colwellia sp.]